MVNQNSVNELIFYLKNVKFLNKLQDLKIEYQYPDSIDEQGWLYIKLIRIKKSQRKKGFGSAVIKFIIKFADTHNTIIKLWPTEIYGTDYEILIKFYKKLGFTLETKFGSETMLYQPKQINI